jgi:hypothetical protein
VITEIAKVTINLVGWDHHIGNAQHVAKNAPSDLSYRGLVVTEIQIKVWNSQQEKAVLCSTQEVSFIGPSCANGEEL